MTVLRKALLPPVLSGVLLALSGAYYFHTKEAKSTINKQALSHVAAISSLARALRPIYPYSVIPGGAFSSAELRSAVARDSHVGQHYSDFDLSRAHLVTLTADRYQYVSFRVKNKIFWTRKVLRIPKGEVLLTDGTSYARTRCGNRLSSQRQNKTTRPEPSLTSLSLPPVSPELLPGLELEKTSDLSPQDTLPTLPLHAPELVAPIPSNGMEALLNAPAAWGPQIDSPLSSPLLSGEGELPFSGGSPSGGGASTPNGSMPSSSFMPLTPPVEVPEPKTLYLFGITLLASLWVLTRMLRSQAASTEIDNDPINEYQS
jgi:hypothetical protein